jgi:hypothetical protein
MFAGQGFNAGLGAMSVERRYDVSQYSVIHEMICSLLPSFLRCADFVRWENPLQAPEIHLIANLPKC